MNNDSIWIFWRDSFFQIEEQRIGTQNHFIRFIWLPTGDSFWCTFVYGLYSIAAGHPLWADLTSFHSSLTIPWLLGGDFNMYLTLDEHKGRSSLPICTLQEFNDFIHLIPYNRLIIRVHHIHGVMVVVLVEFGGALIVIFVHHHSLIYSTVFNISISTGLP